MAEKPMFSSVAELEWSEMTKTVYQVLQVLKEGFRFPPNTLGNELNSAISPLAKQALQEIAIAEQKPVNEIPEEDLAPYKQRLFELLSTRTKQDLAGLSLSGTQLLSQLR